MQQLRLIIHHLQRGLSGRKIALELGLSRNTVKLYTERIEKCSYPVNELQKLDNRALSAIAYSSLEKLAQVPRRSDLTAHIPDYLEDLKGTGVTRRLLWEEYRQKFPEGYGYTQFCELLSREQRLNNASMHFEYVPGDMLLVDFAGDKLSYVDQSSGEVMNCPVLVCVLPFSGYSYAIALPDATLPHVVKGLNQCLAFFGGVPFVDLQNNSPPACQYSAQIANNFHNRYIVIVMQLIV